MNFFTVKMKCAYVTLLACLSDNHRTEHTQGNTWYLYTTATKVVTMHKSTKNITFI